MLDTIKFSGNLVRVVAQDGSVWWTLEAHVESHRAIVTAIPNPDKPVDSSYYDLYYRKRGTHGKP